MRWVQMKAHDLSFGIFDEPVSSREEVLYRKSRENVRLSEAWKSWIGDLTRTRRLRIHFFNYSEITAALIHLPARSYRPPASIWEIVAMTMYDDRRLVTCLQIIGGVSLHN